MYLGPWSALGAECIQKEVPFKTRIKVTRAATTPPICRRTLRPGVPPRSTSHGLIDKRLSMSKGSKTMAT